MSRSPILPVPDWPSIYATGRTYNQWLEAGSNREKCDSIERARRELGLDTHHIAYLTSIEREVKVVAIAEDWCGDVVRHVPVLQAIVAAAPKIDIRYLYRNEHPEIFVRYLTNGGEAIPKFVFFNDDFVECANWGPMPAYCRELIARGKARGDVASARRMISALYDVDANRSIVIRELLQLIDIAAGSML